MVARILAYSDVETAHDDPDRLGRLAGTLSRNRDDETIVVGVGDNLAPGALPTRTDGASAAAFLRALDPDVDVLGNHDLEYGPEIIGRLTRQTPPTWLCANATLADERFGDADATGHLVEEAGGITVGLFGVVPENTPEITPHVGDLRCTDPVSAARESVSALRSVGATVVVGLAHVGVEAAREIASAVDADALLCGHENASRTIDIDGTLVVRLRDLGQEVVELEIAEDGGIDANRIDATDGPMASAVRQTAVEYRSDVGLNRSVTTLDGPLARKTAAGESPIGNFVADAVRATMGADVALVDSGAIRDGAPLRNEVTVADLLSLIPFAQPLTVCSLSGAELRTAVREAIEAQTDATDSVTWQAEVSGLTAVWDSDRDALSSVRVDGEPIRGREQYDVACLNYSVVTDHVFRTLSEAQVVRRREPHHEAIAEYLRSAEPTTDVDGRVRVLDSTADPVTDA